MLIWILAILAILGMILLIIFLPSIKIKGVQFSTFYLPLLLIAILFLTCPLFDKEPLKEALFSDTPLNPIKILALFMSVSVLSISLDQSGFFAHLASWAIQKFKNSQYALFFSLYILISLTTIFTSNDIVILTFTPFIIYLAKHGKIKPIPYLIMEFVAGNTFSMLLSIGNPTNIYLSTVFSIDFLAYLKVMALPTLIIGLSSIIILLLLFRKDLKEPIEAFDLEVVGVEDKPLMWVSLIHLGATIVLLAISNFIHLEMWLITAPFAVSETIFLIIYSICRKKARIYHVYKRLPYSLIPFILSMFVIIMGVDSTGLFQQIGNAFSSIGNTFFEGWVYLTTSTLMCNLVNNIPMSLMYSRILNGSLANVYATIIGSNLGALLTPIGALAGIMWMSILKEKGVKFTFIDFVKCGLPITGFMLLFALASVSIIPYLA